MDGTKIGRNAKRWIVSGALVAAGLVAGGAIAGGQLAQAADTGATSQTAAAMATSPQDVRHGPGETLLTGSIADRVRAAAEEAVHGGTVIRVETDNEGAAYEAHIRKTDGSSVTLKFDEDLNLTDTVDGFGAGPAASDQPSGD
jgi:hypothetical protein